MKTWGNLSTGLPFGRSLWVADDEGTGKSPDTALFGSECLECNSDEPIAALSGNTHAKRIPARAPQLSQRLNIPAVDLVRVAHRIGGAFHACLAQ